VNLEPHHTFVTELHGVAVGRSKPEDVTVPLGPLVRPPDRLCLGEAQPPDFEARTLRVGQRTIAYDVLLLAVGSVPEDYGLPGVQRYAAFLDDLEQARIVHQRLERLARRGWGTVVCVGGGLTGVEFAADVRDRYGARLTVEVVEAGKELMAGIEPPLVRASVRLLREKGVGIRTATRVVEVAADHLMVETPGMPTQALDYDLLVWAAGVRANPLVARTGLTVDGQGRGYVDAYLRSRDQPRLFLAGDCAAFPYRGRELLPPAAQVAEQAGRHAADNLRRVLSLRPLVPFAPRLRGFFASLGEWQGVGELGREQFFGLPAIVVKRLIEAHHAFEAGGLHSLLQRLVRDGGRLMWGEGAAQRLPASRLRRRLPVTGSLK
jgi:NADH dehydrogenase